MDQQLAGIINLTIPAGAGPGDPSVIIGPNVPTLLSNYYAAGGPNGVVGTVIGAIINQQNALTFVYQAFVVPVTGRPFVAFGGVEAVGLQLSEAYRITPGTFGTLTETDWFGPHRLRASSDFLIQSSVGGPLVSQGRGLIARVTNTAASAAIGAAETITLTLPSRTYQPGRAYAMVHKGTWVTSANNGPEILVRKTNVAGQTLYLGTFGQVVAGFGNRVYDSDVFVVDSAGPAVTAVLVQTTITAAGGTTTWQAQTATFVNARAFEVWDIGAQADFPNTPVLT